MFVSICLPLIFYVYAIAIFDTLFRTLQLLAVVTAPLLTLHETPTWDSTCKGRRVYIKRRTALWTNQRSLTLFRNVFHGNPELTANRVCLWEESKLRSRAELADSLAAEWRSQPGRDQRSLCQSVCGDSPIEEYWLLVVWMLFVLFGFAFFSSSKTNEEWGFISTPQVGFTSIKRVGFFSRAESSYIKKKKKLHNEIAMCACAKIGLALLILLLNPQKCPFELFDVSYRSRVVMFR